MARKSDPLSMDSGMTASGSSADPISGQFSKIRSLIGASTPAGTLASTPTAPPTPVAGGPTTGFAAGPNSSDILRQGINLVGQQGAGLSGFGNQLLQSPTDFYSALLSGDPTRMTQALSPTAANINQMYQPLIQQAQQTLPRGGFGASTVAELPFAQQSQINNAALGLQPGAASALTGLGTQEQSLGLQGLQQIINAAIGKMGVTTGITGNLANVGNFISSIV